MVEVKAKLEDLHPLLRIILLCDAARISFESSIKQEGIERTVIEITPDSDYKSQYSCTEDWRIYFGYRNKAGNIQREFTFPLRADSQAEAVKQGRRMSQEVQMLYSLDYLPEVYCS
ncbi:MAG: hypothetical protein RL557_917 [archaeon]|jgi:hypothetical protein